MNSAKFTWEKYCSQMGYCGPEAWNVLTNKPMPGYTEVGRCSASSLRVRPRTEGVAVMLRNDDTLEEFWLHALEDEHTD